MQLAGARPKQDPCACCEPECTVLRRAIRRYHHRCLPNPGPNLGRGVCLGVQKQAQVIGPRPENHKPRDGVKTRANATTNRGTLVPPHVAYTHEPSKLRRHRVGSLVALRRPLLPAHPGYPCTAMQTYSFKTRNETSDRARPLCPESAGLSRTPKKSNRTAVHTTINGHFKCAPLPLRRSTQTPPSH